MTDETAQDTVAEPVAASPTFRHRRRFDALHNLERFGLLLLYIAIVVLFSILRPGTFPTEANWQSIATSESVLAVAAIALVVPLIGGRFDVSVGANLSLCSIATAAVMSKYGVTLVPAVAIGILLGCFVGAINGFLVAYVGVNSIIGTLGTTTIMGGIVTGYTQGIPISTGLSSKLTNLAIDTVAGVPVIFIVMLGVSLVAWFILTQTPAGRKLSAVGSNLSAARLTGLPVNRIVLLCFVGAGGLAGIAGVMEIAANGNADPQVGGIDFILPALAAAFLGATTWRPGVYNVPGTILALFFLGTAISGLTLVGVAPWITDVFNGAAIVVAVALSALVRNRRAGAIEIGQ